MRNAVLVALLGALALPAQAQTTAAGATPGSFRVTESGAAEYRVPIRVPPGIAGMEPRLALVYNSQAGNGLLGVGWSLEGLSAIARCPRTMAQDGARGAVNYDANDRYCLDGQRLIAIAGSYGADGTEYRTERESFSKIVSFGQAGSGPAWFKVWTRSGQILEYGNTADSRIEAQGKPTARLWAVNRISDAKGNHVTLAYAEDATHGDFRPTQIAYAGNAVELEYEARPDAAAQYHAGSILKSDKRLKYVKTFRQAAPLTRYRVDYETSATTSQSRAVAIQECNGDGSACLPATQLAFGAASSSFAAEQSLFNVGADASEFLFPDLNGDGTPDAVAARLVNGAGELRYALANGSGGYGAFATLFSWIGPYDYRDWRVAFGDMNGDGKADLLLARSSNGRAEVYYALSTGSGFGPFQTIVYWDGPYNFSSYRFHLADINGDGRADLFITRNEPYKAEVSYMLWTGAGFGAGGSVIDWAGPYDYSWHGFQFPDIDGDGRADLVVTRAEYGRAEVSFALFNGSGYGPFHKVLEWGGPYNYVGHSYRFADVNGDGKADLFVIRADYINGTGAAYAMFAPSTGQGFGAFSVIFDWGSGPWDFTVYRFHLADLNGDGRADFIFTRAINGAAEANYALSRGDSFSGFSSILNLSGADYSSRRFHFVDLQGRGRADLFVGTAGSASGAGAWRQNAFSLPDLPASISASAGALTSLTWSTAADAAVHAKDADAVYPRVDLATPVHVVAALSSSNGAGGAVATTYGYGGLKAEAGTGRGALGFRWIESSNPSSGVKARTERRQDWPYVGLPSMMRKTQASGAVLSETLNTYGSTSPATGVYFPFVSQSVETGNDLNGAALPAVTTAMQYDGFGNPTSITVGSADGHSKTTTNTYMNDSANWRLGRLTRSSVQSTSP
jgi:hypothetical protein